jgi:hypothetical protein
LHLVYISIYSEYIHTKRLAEKNAAIAGVAFFMTVFLITYIVLRCCFGLGSGRSKKRRKKKRRRQRNPDGGGEDGDEDDGGEVEESDDEGVFSTAEDEWAAVSTSTRNQVCVCLRRRKRGC